MSLQEARVFLQIPDVTTPQAASQSGAVFYLGCVSLERLQWSPVLALPRHAEAVSRQEEVTASLALAPSQPPAVKLPRGASQSAAEFYLDCVSPERLQQAAVP